MSKKPKNPKSMRTALKYGWHKVTVLRQDNLTWMGICLAVDRSVRGRYVRVYNTSGGGTMAFENIQDAVWVSLKFGCPK